MIIAIIVLGILLAMSIGLNIGLYVLVTKLREDKKTLWKAIHNTLEESRNFIMGD